MLILKSYREGARPQNLPNEIICTQHCMSLRLCDKVKHADRLGCCAISILVLHQANAKVEEGFRRNHLRQCHSREETHEGQELWSLAAIRFTIRYA